MKIVSIEHDETKKTVDGQEVIFATIEVETGRFLWKTIATRQVYKTTCGWRFLDSGDWVCMGIDALWDAHEARKLLA